jgi:hypothetical protein
MTLYILTDSEFPSALLERLLTEEERACVWIKAFSGTSMYSMARTLLASRGTPVAVVIDADTPSSKGVTRVWQDADDLLGDVARTLLPYKIIVAVPEIEVLFFRSPELLRRRFDGAVTDHLLELAQYSARGALRKLAADGDSEKLRWEILKSLTDEDVAALRQSDLVREVLEFITLVRQRARPVAKAGV